MSKRLTDFKPTNLEECFEALKEFAKPDQLAEFVEDDPASYHSTVGRAIRNAWGLWYDPDYTIPKTPLYEFMVKLGLHHADDMSGLILESFKRHLLGQSLDVEKQVEAYKEYWRKKSEGGME